MLDLLNLLVGVVKHAVADVFFVLTAILVWHIGGRIDDLFKMPRMWRDTLETIVVSAVVGGAFGGLFYWLRFVCGF